MVRILEMSDIHTEFGKMSRIPNLPPEDSYDIILLPGDIGIGCTGIQWAHDVLPKDKPIFMTNGNHEFYKQDYVEVRHTLQKQLLVKLNEERQAPIKMLDPGVAYYDDLVIIGATLWTSLELKGCYDARATDYYFEQNIADFKLIRLAGDRWDAEYHRKAHEREKEFIIKQLEAHKGKKVIVMTHFVPSQMCIDPIYLNSPLNPYFTVDMDDVMLSYNIVLWVFGHTHSAYDNTHPSGTRLVCNPAGYPGERSVVDWKIIEV